MRCTGAKSLKLIRTSSYFGVLCLFCSADLLELVHLLVVIGGVRSHQYCRISFLEPGVVVGSPSFLWELWFFCSLFPLCSEEKPGPVKCGMFTGRCTTSDHSRNKNCLNLWGMIWGKKLEIHAFHSSAPKSILPIDL